MLRVIDVSICVDLHLRKTLWYSPPWRSEATAEIAKLAEKDDALRSWRSLRLLLIVVQLKDALHQEWLRDRPCDATATTRRLVAVQVPIPAPPHAGGDEGEYS